MGSDLIDKIITTNVNFEIDRNQIIQTEFESAIKEVCSNGNYQKIVFYTIMITSFICGLIITAFSVEKEIPNHFCIDRYDFEDNEEYSIYKNNSDFKIIESEECIEKYCKEHLKVLVADYGEIRNFITMLDTMCHIDSFSGEFTRRLFLGRIIAIFFVSYISDNIGRKVAIQILLVMLLITNIGFFLFRTISAYLILIFFANMCMQLFNLMTVYTVETMSNDVYSLLNGLIGTFYAFCGVFNIIIMYLFKDWIVLLSIHLVLDVIILYIVFAYFVETPKFCLIKKDYIKLTESITFIAKINGIYENNILHILKRIEEISTKGNTNDNIIGAFPTEDHKGKSLYRKLISFMFTIFAPYIKIFAKTKQLNDLCLLAFPLATVYFVYYGQLMFIERLPGNSQLNSFLIFFSELFSPNLAGYLLQKVKRKTTFIVVFLSSIFLCLLLAHTENEIIVSILLFLNSFIICINFVVGYVYAAELIDSSVKTSAMGLLVLFSNLLMLPGDFLLGLFSSPFYLFITLMGVSIVCLIKLTETKV